MTDKKRKFGHAERCPGCTRTEEEPCEDSEKAGIDRHGEKIQKTPILLTL